MPLQLWNRSLFFGKVYLISNTLVANQEQRQDIEQIYINDEEKITGFIRTYLKNWSGLYISCPQPWAHTDPQDVIQGENKPKLWPSPAPFVFPKILFWS